MTDDSIVTADDVSHSDAQSIRIPAATPEHVLSLSFDPGVSPVVFVADLSRWLEVYV
ncbi:MAG: hypothetical protein ACI8Z5_000346 [Lentimonas sp.]|jgi:hypothetical protein